jgi:hypothetical protein
MELRYTGSARLNHAISAIPDHAATLFGPATGLLDHQNGAAGVSHEPIDGLPLANLAHLLGELL